MRTHSVTVAPTMMVVLGIALSFSHSVNAAPIGITEVPLNGTLTDIRSVETNLGNLVADAYFWQTQQSGLSPTIAIVNGGSIRNSAIDFPTATSTTPADIDETWPAFVLPFANDIGTLQVSTSTFLAALENGVSGFDVAAGRFLQVSGFSFSWDTTAPVGARIIDAVLDDGTVLINDGTVVSNILLNIATNTFLAAGGDGYAWNGAAFTGTGVVDREVLASFIMSQGTIRAADYPVGGEGRIQRDAQLVPEPSSLLLLGLGLTAAGSRWRRRAASRSTSPPSFSVQSPCRR